MTKWTLAAAGVMGAMTLAGGCASKGGGEASTTAPGQAGPATATSPMAPPTAAEPVTLVQQASAEQGGPTRGGTYLVKDEAGLAALGVQALEGLSPDWASQDVVILGLGEQNTGGFWANISGMQLVGDTLFVQGTVNSPAADAMTPQVMTAPYAAAVIEETTATRAQGDYEEVTGQPMP